MKVYHELKPIYDSNSSVLILGSMPSVISRRNHFYYAHSSNRFWPIIEKLYGVELKDVKEKREFLKLNKIALWDVIYSCDISGSSDSSIKNVTVNDIEHLINVSQIKYIIFTGKTAYQYYLKFFDLDIPTYCLPSPSSANAKMKLDDLVKEYAIIKKIAN